MGGAIGATALVIGVGAVAGRLWRQRSEPPPDEHSARPVAASAAPGTPSVLVVVLDATRCDALSPYGGESAATTPHIARLAEQGVVFDACYAAASFSGPSYASLLTGRYPPGHGVLDHPSKLAERNRTLLEAAGEAGLYTVHLTQHSFLRRRWRYDQGAAAYRFSKDDQLLVGELAQLLESHRELPLAAFLALTAPHFPYRLEQHPAGVYDALPESDRLLDRQTGRLDKNFALADLGFSPEYVAAQRAAYLEEVGWADRLVGRLTAAVSTSGRSTDTAIIVTADHGEAFGEHGFYFCHDSEVHAPVSRVPLIVSWPGRYLPHRVSAVVSLVDILPTVCGWLGVGEGADLDGRSLEPLLRGAEPDAVATAFCSSRPRWEQRKRYRSIRERYQLPGFAGVSVLAARGPWDLVLRPLASGVAVELYDRARDPLHLADLWAERGTGSEAQVLLEEAGGYRRRLIEAAAPLAVELSAEQREALRQLGYLD